MAVYVDQMQAKFGCMTMCHMLGDTLEELHRMADIIGLKRSWFQSKTAPHYDICKSKRALAVRNGAIEIDIFRAAEIIRAWKNCAMGGRGLNTTSTLGEQ